MQKTVVVIGGGAAGFFGAIQAAERLAAAGHKVVILEGTHKPLTKVKISGGGRCNVTTSVWEPRALVQNYPRGSREMLGPFNRFGPEQMVAWLQEQGVAVHTEADGRMFPESNNSQTIIDCLRQAAEKLGISLEKGQLVQKIEPKDGGFEIRTNKSQWNADAVLLATGSMPVGHKLAIALGHSITRLVPSLFTFKSDDQVVAGLAGISVPKGAITLKLGRKNFRQEGPILITHWGFSGPAVLKNSAFAAVELKDQDYTGTIRINWDTDYSPPSMEEQMIVFKDLNLRKKVINANPTSVPNRLWQRICEIEKLEDFIWAGLSPKAITRLAKGVCQAEYRINGKGEFKEEFVTCGGIDSLEVDFRTMQSKKVPGLFFAGEILNVDGVTGGFNFQAAWTGGWIAAEGIAAHLL